MKFIRPNLAALGSHRSKDSYEGLVKQKQSPRPPNLARPEANAFSAVTVIWCLTKRGYMSVARTFSIHCWASENISSIAGSVVKVVSLMSIFIVFIMPWERFSCRGASTEVKER